MFMSLRTRLKLAAMSSPGNETIAGYERAAARYRSQVSALPPPAVAELIDRVVPLLPAGARCLELGSGPGHDARELERRGVRVDRTDATQAFVDMLRADGHDARRLDVRYDDFGGPYDLVWADAVLLHLTRPELGRALRAARAAVAPSGLLAITVKEGDGEQWSSARLDVPRYFVYWREEPLRAELAAAGWAVEWLAHVPGRFDDWLYVVARAG
jgi:SAM-dependent methyltransferase